MHKNLDGGFGQFRLAKYTRFLFSVAVDLFVLFPPTSRDFQLDEKEPKNQENPNGQTTCNSYSADFLPPCAGMLSGNFDQQICKESAFRF
jgi:hypothetical protein